jgi:hypothetical protein
MSILIVPYEGESNELVKALKKYAYNIPKKECNNGSCRLQKPFRMLNENEVKNSVLNTLENSNITQIYVLALTKKDQTRLIEMSRTGNWVNIKKDIKFNIIIA